MTRAERLYNLLLAAAEMLGCYATYHLADMLPAHPIRAGLMELLSIFLGVRAGLHVLRALVGKPKDSL